MSDHNDDDPELERIERIDTPVDAIDYLMSRGMQREVAEALVFTGLALAAMESLEASAITRTH